MATTAVPMAADMVAVETPLVETGARKTRARKVGAASSGVIGKLRTIGPVAGQTEVRTQAAKK